MEVEIQADQVYEQIPADEQANIISSELLTPLNETWNRTARANVAAKVYVQSFPLSFGDVSVLKSVVSYASLARHAAIYFALEDVILKFEVGVKNLAILRMEPTMRVTCSTMRQILPTYTLVGTTIEDRASIVKWMRCWLNDHPIYRFAMCNCRTLVDTALATFVDTFTEEMGLRGAKSVLEYVDRT